MARYTRGQQIVYANTGVCVVEGIGPKSFCGAPPAEYYTLRPLLDDETSKIYAPASAEARMRPVMQPAQAQNCLETLKTMDVEAYYGKSQQLLSDYYRELLHTDDFTNYLKLYKGLCRKEQQQKARGKKLNNTDTEYYRLTEKRISQELACALQIPQDQMKEQLHAAALCG